MILDLKNKLMSMNLDPSIIDKPYSGPIINTNKNKLMDDINKMNFKLNKTSDIKTIHKSKSIYEAPSLEEIMLKLNNLKAVP